MSSVKGDVQRYIRKLSDAFFKVSNEKSSELIKDYTAYKNLRNRLEPHKQIINDIKFQANFEQAIKHSEQRLSNIDQQKAQIEAYVQALEASDESLSSILIAQLRLQNDNLNLLQRQTNLEIVSLTEALSDLTHLKNVL